MLDPAGTRSTRSLALAHGGHLEGIGVEVGRADHLGEYAGELVGEGALVTGVGRDTPPYAESGSHSWASRCASAMSAPTAMPHGLACLMIATHGSLKS